MGEFDKQYIADLTRYEFARLRAEEDEKNKLTAEEAKAKEAHDSIVNDWNQRLNKAKEEKYPDFESKVESINTEFADLEPAYGDYLASTIMAMENGTDVLYYLANNVDEAKAIAKSGAVAATLALGRLEARLSTTPVETKPKTKTSNAPEPPPTFVKGGAAVKQPRVDTDDLDDFKDLLWPQRKRK
jgi:hypothetical protein